MGGNSVTQQILLVRSKGFYNCSMDLVSITLFPGDTALSNTVSLLTLSTVLASPFKRLYVLVFGMSMLCSTSAGLIRRLGFVCCAATIESSSSAGPLDNGVQ